MGAGLPWLGHLSSAARRIPVAPPSKKPAARWAFCLVRGLLPIARFRARRRGGECKLLLDSYCIQTHCIAMVLVLYRELHIGDHMIIRKSKPVLVLVLAIVVGIVWVSTATYVVASMPTRPVLLDKSQNAATSIHRAKSTVSNSRADNHPNPTSDANTIEPAQLPVAQPPATDPQTKVYPCPECPVELMPSDDITPICQDNCVQPNPYRCPPCAPGPGGRMMCMMIACRAIDEQDAADPSL